MRFGALVPGRCGLLTESSTHGRTGCRPPQCCRLIREVRFASGDLLNACVRCSLRRAVTDAALPHASCVEQGQNILPSNAAWVAGPGRICLWNRSRVSGTGCQVLGCGASCVLPSSWRVLLCVCTFVFCSPIIIGILFVGDPDFCLQLCGHQFRIRSAFSNAVLLIHNVNPF